MSTQTSKIRTPILILMRSLFIVTLFYCLRSTRLVFANGKEESFCEKRLREYDEDRREYREHCVYNSGDQSPSCCNVIKESLEDRVRQYRILCPHEGRILLPDKTDGVESSILNGTDAKFIEQIKQWLPVKTRWNLCYRATKDGWEASAFHSRCDNKGATVTIVRVGKYIFGGYNDLSWTGSGYYKSSSNAFLFSLRNKDNLKPFKAPVYRNSWGAIIDYSGYGPTFGYGRDLYIANNAHSSTGSSRSFTNFGRTYQPPSGYSAGSSNTGALLAGSYYFTPSEVGVFYFG